MKNLIIVALLAALAGSFYVTRPSPGSFKDYVVAQASATDKNFLTKGWDEGAAARFADSAEFRDRYLWIDVVQNGKTLYTGALGHWFNHAIVADQARQLKEKV